ncbi:hypothetical protein CANARDRAFT_26378 [[Candida] arabinofermentans NRRL YB-2248]|uniref:Elongation factor 1 alpha-like protein n=1 Tax=[Candida] arabinofermentans NRRL YB-2248 TaxID=983967 RepID=A0A1E4T901_9ASCO|nr:hypothetical protein CANARDRAFT_26378 [[Candida] arabinofermentans NRRL YB-2248]
MNDYDDDDIIDYENDTQAGEQFNEDNLNDEDYNLLYDLLPELKEKTKLYQIPDDKLKELLWLNYFELDDTLEEIKRDFKPKKTTSNFQKPSPDEQKKELHKITQIISGVNLEESSKPAPKKKLTTTKPKTKINVDKELQTKNQKPNLSFVVIGHVDSGKSTMIGRLLYDLKIVDSKTLHKLTKESENIGKASFSLAWIMDQTSEERSRGVTVDICQTQFETETSSFTIIDSPGHKDYVPQMINGVTQADIAIVIIDANSFESGFDTQGQTREHLTIAKNLGMEKCIIAINKMDTNSWSEHRFEQIRDTLAEFLLDDLQYEKRNIIYIPVSGYLGDNVVNKVKKTECPWYSGKTLIEILEQENQLVNHAIDKESPFIMTINDIQELSRNDELLISGRINSGLIQPGESIIISPSQETGVVDSISITMSNVGSSSVKNDLQKLAIKGEFVELKLKKLDVLDNIKVGDLVTLINNKITPVKNFQCELNLFNLERPLLIGTPFILFRSNISIPARLSTIHSIENTKSGKVSKKRKHLSSNNRAIVDIEILDRDIPLVTFDDDMKLGRLVIRKDGMTIGAGKVTKLL